MNAAHVAECLELEWQEPSGAANLSRVFHCDHAFCEGEWVGDSGEVRKLRVCERCGRLEAKWLAVACVRLHPACWDTQTNEV